MSKSRSHCAWRGTAARGVYSAACRRGQHINGVPSGTCPGCGRPIKHYVSKPRRTATLADYQRWKKKRAQTV